MAARLSSILRERDGQSRSFAESRTTISDLISAFATISCQGAARFVPYISGGVGGGWIDSHANIPGAQGQDFTFNILSAAGISYMVNDHWKLDVGALYQHLSNGGQTDPNPSLNLFGPQVGVTYSF